MKHRLLNVLFIGVMVFVSGLQVRGDAGGEKADKAPKKTKFTIDHALGLKRISDIQVSPDGDWVAYTVKRVDEEKDKNFSQIWMSDIQGENSVPMTAADANATRPRWLPDGSALSFLGSRGVGEDETSQVWTLDRRGGEAQQYTHIKDGVDAYAWSPDGTSLLLAITDPEEGANEGEDGKDDKDEDKPKPHVIDRLQFKFDYTGYLDRRRTHYYLDNGTEDPIQLTFGDYDDYGAVWHPDSGSIAFVSKRHGDPDANDNSDIWLVSTDRQAAERPLIQITTNVGPDENPAWSPNGKMLAYTTSRQPERLWYDTHEIAMTEAKAGGSERVLTADLDRMSFDPSFSSNGKSIYFISDHEGNNPLMKVNIRTGDIDSVTTGRFSVSGYDARHKSRLIVSVSEPDKPYELYALKRGKLDQITQVNSDLIKDLPLALVDRLTVNGWQGDPVDSWLYYPHDYDSNKKYPVIFDLHGGPVSQHNSDFDTWPQLFAANGYVVVQPNPHGSTGYGEAFTFSLNRQWGVPDFADVEAIADHLVDAGIADPDRLGVGGWSYGGILTNYVITKSDRFAAAVSGASEVNFLANYGHDHYQYFWEAEMGLPWEEKAAWEAIDIFKDVHKITTPTLIMGGALDWNVPIQNSEQMYQVLKRRGVDTLLVVYPNEYHGIRLPTFRRDRLQRFLDWYDKYLKP